LGRTKVSRSLGSVQPQRVTDDFGARSPAEPTSPSGSAQRYAGPFVVWFLGTLIVCALAGWNLWPFSSWELFSRLRTDHQIGWQMVAVDRAGRELVDPIVSLPHGSRGVASFMIGLPRRPTGERNAICRDWFRRARERYGSGTRLLRVYRLDWLLSERRGDRAAPPHRTQVWVCAAEGERAAV
jgi:hypothetical protein